MLIGLLVGWLLRSDEVDTAAVGASAPDFTVELIGGGTFNLVEHFESDGRPVVLNLWASWCLPCRQEMPEISAFSVAHPEVKVLGVAVEDREANALAFAQEISPEYDLAMGYADFEEAYPRLGLPVTYIIDSDGKVAEVFNGILDRQTLEELVLR